MKTWWLLLAASVAANAAGPAWQAAAVPTPSAFQETSSAAGTTSQPAALSEWWRVFNDPVLNSLLARATKGNLDVRIAAFRVAEARAAAGLARSGLLPEVGQSTSVNQVRGGYSQGVIRVGGGSQVSQGGSFISPFESSIIQAGFQARWEIDLFGGLRQNLKAAKADAAASEETQRDVLLVVTAEAARH